MAFAFTRDLVLRPRRSESAVVLMGNSYQLRIKEHPAYSGLQGG